MNTKTKLAALVLASSLLFGSYMISFAQSENTSPIDEDVEVVVIDSNAIISSEQADRIASLEESIKKLENDIKLLKDNDVSYYEISDDIRNWVLLIICAICLPAVLIYLYINNTKHNEKKYNTLVDLVRSGVEIKPEILPFLTGQTSNNIITKGIGTGMNQYDLNYCTKRVLWGVIIILMGFFISMLASDGTPFTIFLFLGIIPILQAIVRYFNVAYMNKHSKPEASNNTIEQNAQNTENNNAQ